MALPSFWENTNSDFSSGPVVKNPPSNAGHVGSIPGQGTKIPLAFCLTTTEPAGSRVHVLQLEKCPHAATKTQHSQKRETEHKYFFLEVP